MSVVIALDPGVPTGTTPLEGPRPDPRSPAFRDLEEKTVARFRVLAREYGTARRRRSAVVVPGHPELVLDGSLLGRMVLSYSTQGWSGIEQARDALLALQRGGKTEIEDGLFFAAVRDLLSHLIGRTLVDLEARAAQLATDALKSSSEQLEKGSKQLGLKTQQIGRFPAPVDDEPDTSEPVHRHTLENHELCGRLHTQLLAVAKEFVAVAAFKRHLAVVPKPGSQDEKDLKESIESYAKRAGTALQAAVFTKECPIGLLGVRLVDLDTTQEQFEGRLAQVLQLLTESVTDVRKTALGERAPGVVGPSATRLPEGRVHLADFRPSLEVRLLTKAAEGIENDRAWLPLLHEETWDRMLAEPGLVQGGFGYAVAGHYRLALLERKKADEARAAEKSAIWRWVEIIAAGLSIAALILFPWGAVPLLTVALETGAAAAALVVATHQIVELYTQVQLAKRLVVAGLMVGGSAAQGAEVLAGLGALAQFRLTVYGEALKDIGLVALGELIGTRLAAARHAVRGYGYVQDIKTLLGPAR
ncbi:hypothetical protein [Streptomyces pseudovenezuelae]|uniref:Uncharacterized protein n=1 Tax=Streptomyces pseudovenezuelae TaxID=67350 RepID=A0ABT6LYV2_9ACTN|nr:hypothetical protein [Streptomyces pseudovenezuelae]MDH6221475.1 hypothetical protein [Streptomyces pseudovenezuelae]